MAGALVCFGYMVTALAVYGAWSLATRARARARRRAREQAPVQGPCPCGAFGCHGKIEVRNGGNGHG